tara:strand:+ start:237 stop:578 length:342 start_codon:yes stop_codon:yes gene_type:complete
MEKQIEKLIQDIKDDYVKWTSHGGKKELNDINKKMIADHDAGLGYKVGQKYIKITNNNGGSVWGFVVNTDNDSKFKKGDILMAAGFNAPARNKARGNVFTGYDIRWTGPHYLN